MSNQFIGKLVVAETTIEKGKRGKVTFKGASWSAESDFHIKKGEYVKIVGKDSILLKVEPNEK